MSKIRENQSGKTLSVCGSQIAYALAIICSYQQTTQQKLSKPMATITKLAFFKHLRAEPNQFVLHFTGGKLKRSGPGIAYWFLPLSAALAQVPVEDVSTTFVLNERSRDYQAVKLQCTVIYRVSDPERAVSRVNFSIGVQSGVWNERPLESIATLWMQRALTPTRNYLATATLEEALREGPERMRAALMNALGKDPELGAMGLALVGVVIDQIAPLAEVEKALQTPAREAIQGKADEATFQRRAQAVEKERAIKENELATELELERKQEQLIQQRGDNALAQVRQNNAAEQAKVIAEVERLALAAEGGAKRTTLEAHAQADAQRSLASARLEEDRAQHEIWKATPSQAALGLVMARFAENVHTVGNINITPELLAQNFQNWLQDLPSTPRRAADAAPM
jgi:regulator of protease activity HflC (stomatin/prohibitin superfamily)